MTMSHCLVIDDDAIAAVFLGDWLRQRGWQVAHARSLAEASRQLTTSAFDVLLVDRHLPDGDGVGWLAQRWVELGHGAAPRCLVTSGDRIDPASLPTGVGQLRKPIDLDDLRRWLDAVAPMEASGGEPQSGNGRDWESVALLDDTGALARFGGHRPALQSLRAMLISELKDSPRWRTQLAQTPPTADALDALHRLRAACALTGCARLGQVSEAMEAGLRRGESATAADMEALDSTLEATIRAISG